MERPKNIEIIDVLEQIQRQNKLIALHKDAENDIMVAQYEDLKHDYTLKLNQILAKYNIDIKKLKEIGGERKADFYAPLVKKER